jgi:hypothetical protein
VSDRKRRRLLHCASIVDHFTDTTFAPSTPASSIADITSASTAPRRGRLLSPPHVATGGEGIGVDGDADGELLGLLVVYSELAERGIQGPPLHRH